MIANAGVVQSISANLIDTSGGWLWSTADVYSQDYAQVLAQPISVEVNDVSELRFLAAETTLTIRQSPVPTSLVLWSGVAVTVPDPQPDDEYRGTVTSVGLVPPALMVSTGGPITDAGAITLMWHGSPLDLVLADGSTYALADIVTPPHNSLTGRGVADAHPMSAITGLVSMFGNYLPLAAGPSSPLAGTLHGTSLYFSGWTADAPIVVAMNYSNAFTRAITVVNFGLTAGQRLTVDFGQSAYTNNQANFGFVYAAAGSTANKITLGLYGNNDLVTIAGTGVVTVRDLGTGFVRATSGVLSASALASADLPNSGVTAATYGSATQAAVVVVDAKGRITSASNVTIAPAWTSITGKPTTLAGYGITDATLQNAYNASPVGATTPQILTSAAKGALYIRRGSAADTDNVFVVENGSGADQFLITGNGDVTARRLVLTKDSPTYTDSAALELSSSTPRIRMFDTASSGANQQGWEITCAGTYLSWDSLTDAGDVAGVMLAATKAPDGRLASVAIGGGGYLNGGLIINNSTGIATVLGGYSTQFGTASQFLKADGSLDSTAYVTNATVANVDVTEHSANNINYPVVWDNGARSLFHTPAKMWFNPYSGLFAATAIASGSTLSWGGGILRDLSTDVNYTVIYGSTATVGGLTYSLAVAKSGAYTVINGSTASIMAVGGSHKLQAFSGYIQPAVPLYMPDLSIWGTARSSDGGRWMHYMGGGTGGISNATSTALIQRYQYGGFTGFIANNNEFYGLTQDHQYSGPGAQLSIVAGQSAGRISFFVGAPALKASGNYQAPLVGDWTNAGLGISGYVRPTSVEFTGYGISGIYNGSGDNATYTTYNLKIKSWWGVGFESYDGVTRAVLDTRYGNFSVTSNLTAGPAQMSGWTVDATNFARFGHSSWNNASGFGLLQYHTGEVWLEAPSGRAVNLRINGTGTLVANGSGVSVTGTLSASSTLAWGGGGAIGSSRHVVQGVNDTRSTNSGSWTSVLPSGFYDNADAGNTPSGSWCYMINTSHTGSGPGNQYQSQIATDFWNDRIWFRRIAGGGVNNWREFWHTGNLGFRDWTADASYTALYPSGVTPNSSNFALCMKKDNGSTLLNAGTEVEIRIGPSSLFLVNSTGTWMGGSLNVNDNVTMSSITIDGSNDNAGPNLPSGCSQITLNNGGTSILPAPVLGRILVITRITSAPVVCYVKPASGNTVSYIDLGGVKRIGTNALTNGFDVGAVGGSLLFVGASSTAWSLIGACPTAT